MRGPVLMADELATVRLRSADIENFKSVQKGHVDFVAPADGGASITGVYGQNGSGKTALIDALAILQRVLSGRPLAPETAEEISISAGQSSFKWTFEFAWPGRTQTVSYAYELKRIDPIAEAAETPVRCQIVNEVVRVQAREEKRMRTRKLIDTSAGSPFSPLEQFRALTGGGGAHAKTRLSELKRLARESGRSFVFSLEFRETILDSRDRNDFLVLHGLFWFGMAQLFVVTSRDIVHLSSDQLHLHYPVNLDASNKHFGTIQMPTNSPFAVRSEQLPHVQNALDRVSNLLERIVPGHRIFLQTLEKTRGSDGTEYCRVQLMAGRNRSEFPFRHESDGIKKLVAVLMQLARVYCSDKVTLAVDELDAGVFEILLGDLLGLLRAEGAGQLIFTAHNLYPLEVLEPENVVFTTVDPSQRYKRLDGVRKTNNFRKIYLREIFLQSSQPPLYDATDVDEIAMAFEEAGQYL